MSLTAPFILGFLIFTLSYFVFFNKFVALNIFLLINLVLAGIFTIILISTLAVAGKGWSTKEYIFTQDTVTIIDGLMNVRRRSNNLKGMVGADITQTYIAKKFNYGTITINFMGGGSLRIRNIHQPVQHLTNVHRLINDGKLDL